MDRRRMAVLAARPVNAVLRPVAGVLPWWALLETRGRVTGRPHRTPITDGLEGDTFWWVSEHGYASDHVRNIQADPRVRIRTHGRWRTGTAHPLPDDDVRARQRAIGAPVNQLVVRVAGTDLLTVRIDLDP